MLIPMEYYKLARRQVNRRSDDPTENWPKTVTQIRTVHRTQVFVFHQLTEALNCLVTPGLREDLDQEIKRKKEKIRRDRKLDDKELKLRRELEERERKKFKDEENIRYDEERINHLRNEAGKLLEEEHNNIINKLNRLEIREEKEDKPLIKIKWTKNTFDY